MPVSLSASLSAASQAALAPAIDWKQQEFLSVRPFSLEPSAKVIPSPCEFSSMWSCFRLLVWLHSAGKVAVAGNSQEGASAGWQLGLSSVVNFK